MTSLVDRLLPDALWHRVQPLLPPPPPRPRGGVPRRVPDRNCVAALVFMARTSTPWSLLPARELGCGSATTCWRRVRATPSRPAGRARHGRPRRPRAGERGLLQPAGGQGGPLTGANPTDRGKAGSKLHLAGDAGGLPLTVVLSAANANDATMFEAVLDDVPPVLMPTGRRRRRPGKVHADKAYDHRHCWTIERTIAWLAGCRRLRIRYDRSDERFYALAMLACSVICFNALRQPP